MAEALNGTLKAELIEMQAGAAPYAGFVRGLRTRRW